MNRRIKLLTAGFTMVGIVGFTLTPLTQKATAAPRRYAYSAKLVQPYSNGCAKVLTENGKSLEQAKTICQCSLGQMQQQHDQTQAILILTKAQYLSATDPKTGMPSDLSKYFTPCL